jgi:hypothetical protein
MTEYIKWTGYQIHIVISIKLYETIYKVQLNSLKMLVNLYTWYGFKSRNM